ncbi:hypothetical protein DWV13_11580 [Clostridium botulinum]|uniref:hypothetical protein n=1 Tax=Clostridium TaxID=1485 RepID=UPI0013F9827C|nr:MULTISPECIES: hypothetical protein [Clostridium]MCS6132261.1 hypothetical protein [Clostridium botulinum]NFL45671.1 hypothetical protein [Clostridium botulinum]NFL90568.1 hypothetical protein [Clostridium botulinum]
MNSNSTLTLTLKEAFNNNFNIEHAFRIIKNQEGCSVSLSKDDLAINSSSDKGIFKCAIFSDDIDSLSTGRFSWASKR